mgnify:CR=1 FL=1
MTTGDDNARFSADLLAGLADTGVEAELTKVQALDEIAAFGVTSLPGLAVDGEVVSTGRIPKRDQIIGWLDAAKK